LALERQRGRIRTIISSENAQISVGRLNRRQETNRGVSIGFSHNHTEQTERGRTYEIVPFALAVALDECSLPRHLLDVATERGRGRSVRQEEHSSTLVELNRPDELEPDTRNSGGGGDVELELELGGAGEGKKRRRERGVEGGAHFRKLKIGRGIEDVVRLSVRGEGGGGEKVQNRKRREDKGRNGREGPEGKGRGRRRRGRDLKAKGRVSRKALQSGGLEDEKRVGKT
jgi:hypothetical protein